MIVDTDASIRFLRTAYEPDDWIAVFLKSYETGQTLQRVGPLSLFLEPRRARVAAGDERPKRFNVLRQRQCHQARRPFAHEGRH